MVSYCFFFMCFSILKEGISKNAPKKVCKTCEDIITLGESINDRIKSPSGLSEDFIEDIQICYESIEKIMDGIKVNNTICIHDFFKIKSTGGPAHLLLYPVSAAPLVTFYEWDSFTTWQFRGLMKYTWVLWQDMEDYITEHHICNPSS
ncbi:hypothetical protein J6590_058648 [Homalodisca vitripennis]|nr:hypothetical protein J6590_058648 [Homalodisca vitripennis]